jgi:tRNA(fMet)-specific endonuclease VapC
MATLLVDTDVYSFVTSKRNSALAQLYLPHLRGNGIALSFVTVGEQYKGILKKINKGEWPQSKIAELEQRLRLVVIVPYDIKICKTWGELASSLKNPSGTDRLVGSNDLWIAACALELPAPIVTHNRKHFEGIPGLTIICEAP